MNSKRLAVFIAAILAVSLTACSNESKGEYFNVL